MESGDRVVDPVMLTGVTKSGNATNGWTLSATWSGGTAPYTMVSSTDPSFQKNVVTNAAESPGFNLDMKVDSSDPGKFFNVVDGTTVSPAVQGSGFDPLPAPNVSFSSTTDAWWRQPVTLSGNFFSPIAEENLAYINDLGVRASLATSPPSGNFSNSVEFEIPEDARSFPAAVNVCGKSDHSGLFGIFMSPPGIGPYTGITGVSWSEQTGHIWVAAEGVVQDVDLFKVTPAAVSVGSFTRPYISRVTTGGKILVIDRDADFLIVEIDVNSQTISPFASTADDSFTRDIEPVGIAVDPDGTVAYVADGSTGRVVRIPRNSGQGSSEITDRWGGRDFSFVDPVGVDVAPGHQVIVADNSTQWTWQLTGQSSSSSQHWAGQNVHSIEVDRGASQTAHFRYVIDGDPGMTEAFNRNAIGSNPARYHGGRVYGMTDGTLRLNYDWIYGDLRKRPKKVLLSNAVSAYPYPSSPLQDQDRIIELKAEAWAGVPVRLRLIDPPDPAAYAPAGGWGTRTPVPPYEGNDNVVWGWQQSGEDYGLATNSNATAWYQEIDVTPGSDNTYTYYLKVPPDVSGENFQVEMRKCDPSGNLVPEQVVGMSGVYTSWKRVFVERDKMFRKGGVLAEDFLTEPGTCGVGFPKLCCGDAGALPCNQVKVYEWTNVTAPNGSVPGDTVAFFGEVHTFENGQPEFREVLAIGPSADGIRIITLSGDLSRNYKAAARTTSKPYQPTFGVGADGQHHSAGFGVVSGCDLSPKQINQVASGSILASCFYDPDTRGLEKPFGDAFVEFDPPRDGMSALPFISGDWFTLSASTTRLIYLSRTWFKHYSGGTKDVRTNFFHLIGATKMVSGADNVQGRTMRDVNFTYIFEESIEEYGSNLSGSAKQIQYLSQRNTVHEFGHQFGVNLCSGGDGHDTRNAWCTDHCEPRIIQMRSCLMAVTVPTQPDDWDGYERFCQEDLFLGCGASSSPPEHAIRIEEEPVKKTEGVQ